MRDLHLKDSAGHRGYDTKDAEENTQTGVRLEQMEGDAMSDKGASRKRSQGIAGKPIRILERRHIVCKDVQ